MLETRRGFRSPRPPQDHEQEEPWPRLDALHHQDQALPHELAADATASVDFAGSVIAGGLPRRALSLVAEWARLHEAELVANWERARRDEPLEPIDALA